jgi:hypothetical protein
MRDTMNAAAIHRLRICVPSLPSALTMPQLIETLAKARGRLDARVRIPLGPLPGRLLPQPLELPAEPGGPPGVDRDAQLAQSTVAVLHSRSVLKAWPHRSLSHIAH